MNFNELEKLRLATRPLVESDAVQPHSGESEIDHLSIADAEHIELRAAWRAWGSLLPRGDMMLDVEPLVAKAVAVSDVPPTSSARPFTFTHDRRPQTAWTLVAAACLAIVGLGVVWRMQPSRDGKQSSTIASSRRPLDINPAIELAWEDSLDDELAAADERLSSVRDEWRTLYTTHDWAADQADSLQNELDSGAL